MPSAIRCSGVDGLNAKGGTMASVRTVVGQWIPPALLGLRNKPRTDTRIFGSYAEALKQCGAGYEAEVITEVVVAKTEVIRVEIEKGRADLDLGALRTLIALGFAGQSQPLRVLDFGGAAGFHYFIARATLVAGSLLDWNVVETAAMARAASRLANEELSFFSSIGEAAQALQTPPDLVFASGVLMCVPDPLETLAELLALRAPRVFLTRTGLSPDSTTRIIAQKFTLAENGPGPLPEGVVDQEVSCPDTFVPMAEFERVITSSQYRIVARIKEDTQVWFAGNMPINQYGYLCELS